MGEVVCHSQCIFNFVGTCGTELGNKKTKCAEKCTIVGKLYCKLAPSNLYCSLQLLLYNGNMLPEKLIILINNFDEKLWRIISVEFSGNCYYKKCNSGTEGRGG